MDVWNVYSLIKRTFFLVIKSQLFLLYNFSTFLYIFTLFIHPSILNLTNITSNTWCWFSRTDTLWYRLCFSINLPFLFGLLVVNFSLYIYIYIYIYIEREGRNEYIERRKRRKYIYIYIFQAAVASILLYGCTTWTLTKRLEKKLDGNYTRMLRAILNKSWRQHPKRH